MQSNEQELAQLIADATAALDLEQCAAEKAEAALLRQIQVAMTMEEKQDWFKTWISERLPARLVDVLQIDCRFVAENGGYWYAYFLFRGTEYQMYINGNLGVSLYAPKVNCPSIHELILELTGRTPAEKAGLQLLAAVGRRTSALDKFRASAA